jgi:predicted nucleic acid-binding protein
VTAGDPYLDTSSLVKLYVTEAHSALVRAWSEEAEIIATCRVAYPETVSAFSRRYRNGDLTKRDYDRVMKTFDVEWPHYAVIDFDELMAGRLAETYGLRGFDAVHLSSAKLLQSSASDIDLSFSSFDDMLNKAVVGEKIFVIP